MEVGKNGDPSNQSPRQQDSWIQIASRKPSPMVVGVPLWKLNFDGSTNWIDAVGDVIESEPRLEEGGCCCLLSLTFLALALWLDSSPASDFDKLILAAVTAFVTLFMNHIYPGYRCLPLSGPFLRLQSTDWSKLDQILGLNRSARLNGDIGLWTFLFHKSQFYFA